MDTMKSVDAQAEVCDDKRFVLGNGSIIGRRLVKSNFFGNIRKISHHSGIRRYGSQSIVSVVIALSRWLDEETNETNGFLGFSVTIEINQRHRSKTSTCRDTDRSTNDLSPIRIPSLSNRQMNKL